MTERATNERFVSVVQVGLPILLGLVVGIATSFGQARLDLPWLALVNSASPWLLIAFFSGAIQRGWGSSCAAGLGCALLAVGGYYATSHWRGFGVNASYVILWGLCAVLGGPVFGAAAWLWRRRNPPGLGAALPPAAFIAEGISYQLRLGYTGSAVIMCAVGLVLLIILGRPHYPETLGWLLPTTFLGLGGFWAIGTVIG